ncbi:ATP-binding protein [Sphingomonas bisphenolicum]|uniref:ATP-binding protein n=1 Tax=Sphingomonas bisphenolicum TaxID=296544 RepID=UPI002905761A|nr:ATP-binding protein [Sphingomonas bisphenolicum]
MVLTILGDNAQQAGASRLDIVLVVREGIACFDLVDDGPGIPQGDRIRFFDPFFTSKRDRGGTGVGWPSPDRCWRDIAARCNCCLQPAAPIFAFSAR